MSEETDIFDQLQHLLSYEQYAVAISGVDISAIDRLFIEKRSVESVLSSTNKTSKPYRNAQKHFEDLIARTWIIVQMITNAKELHQRWRDAKVIISMVYCPSCGDMTPDNDFIIDSDLVVKDRVICSKCYDDNSVTATFLRVIHVNENNQRTDTDMDFFRVLHNAI